MPREPRPSACQARLLLPTAVQLQSRLQSLLPEYSAQGEREGRCGVARVCGCALTSHGGTEPANPGFIFFYNLVRVVMCLVLRYFGVSLKFDYKRSLSVFALCARVSRHLNRSPLNPDAERPAIKYEESPDEKRRPQRRKGRDGRDHKVA